MSGGTHVIRAKDFVEDFHCGMSNSDLLRKYRLSAKGLRSVFRKLLDAKVLSKDDILRRFLSTRGLRRMRSSRRFPRKRIRYPLLVCDAESPEVKGFVRDISEKGIAVEGIEAGRGDLRALMIRSNELSDTSTFEFVVECRWARKNEDSGEFPVSGFEIT
ncbi:unnamed protein product, partial [marine sediment metagenome]